MAPPFLYNRLYRNGGAFMIAVNYTTMRNNLKEYWRNDHHYSKRR